MINNGRTPTRGPARPRGRLHIFLGAAPGAGKTHAMLTEACRRAAAGQAVVIALVETHGRPDLMAVARGLDVIPPRRISYRGTVFDEPDYEAVRSRRPDAAVVDELAHSNVPGCRHEKRWQDVKELLDEGIDVFTTLNIQHLARFHDEVERITGVAQREFVPEEMVLGADRVEFIDVDPETIRARLGSRGRIFYHKKLEALRMLALSWLGEHGLAGRGPGAVVGRSDPVVVAVAPGAPAQLAVRRAAELAAQRHAELIGVHVRDAGGLTASAGSSSGLDRMVEDFGGRFNEVGGIDVADALARFARQEHAGVVVIGDSSHTRRHRLMHGSVARRTLRLIGATEVYVVPARAITSEPAARRWTARVPRHVALPARRRMIGWLTALLLPTALLAALVAVRNEIGLAGALLCALLSVVVTAVVGGVGPAILATVTALLSADFSFAEPYYSLRVAHWIDVVALVVFSVVGVIVGILVDVLAARARQTARFRAEATQVTRMAARALVTPSTSPADLVAELRRTFDLDSVGLMARADGGWQVLASAGSVLPENPDDAQFSAELAPDRVLVMKGRGLTRSDVELVRVFAAELLLARRRVEHDELRGAAEGRRVPQNYR